MKALLCFLVLSILPLFGQDPVPGWKRIKVLSDRTLIASGVDVTDPSWNQLQFRWKAPCSANNAHLTLYALPPKEKGAKALGSQLMDLAAKSGGYVFPIPQGTATVMVIMRGDRCTSNLEMEVFAPYTPSTAETDFDFRQTKWGMSKEQVIAAEGTPVAATEGKDQLDQLGYETEVAGLKASTILAFVNGKMARAGYVLLETYAEPNQYVISFGRWLDGLKEKYGAPKPDIQWLNDLYRKDEKKYAFAISAGHLIIRDSWETERTTIQLIMSGKNFQVTVAIIYTSKELQAELEKKEKDLQKKVF